MKTVNHKEYTSANTGEWWRDTLDRDEAIVTLFGCEIHVVNGKFCVFKQGKNASGNEELHSVGSVEEIREYSKSLDTAVMYLLKEVFGEEL